MSLQQIGIRSLLEPPIAAENGNRGAHFPHRGKKRYNHQRMTPYTNELDNSGDALLALDQSVIQDSNSCSRAVTQQRGLFSASGLVLPVENDLVPQQRGESEASRALAILDADFGENFLQPPKAQEPVREIKRRRDEREQQQGFECPGCINFHRSIQEFDINKPVQIVQ